MKKIAVFLLVLALLIPAARAEGPLWLHGDFAGAKIEGDTVVRDTKDALNYSKLLYLGDLTVFAAGSAKEDGEFLTPEDQPEGLSALEALGDLSVGGYPARRWRFVGEGIEDGSDDVRWDMVQIDAGEWICNVMIAAPIESAADHDEEIASLIASMSLQDSPQDGLEMLTADFSDYSLFMDAVYPGAVGDPARATAYFYGDEDSVSVTIMRGDPEDSAIYASLDSMRKAFVFSGAEELTEMEIDPISGYEATRLRYWFVMDNGTRARTDAVLISTENCGYAAMIGLMVEPTEHYDTIIENLIASLAIA